MAKRGCAPLPAHLLHQRTRVVSCSCATFTVGFPDATIPLAWASLHHVRTRAAGEVAETETGERMAAGVVPASAPPLFPRI